MYSVTFPCMYPCTLTLRAPFALWSTPAVYSASLKQSLAPISRGAQHATRAETPPTCSSAAFEACHILPSRLIFPHTPSPPSACPPPVQDCRAPLSFCLHFPFSAPPSAPATCFILTPVAALGEMPHCLGLIRHQSWNQERDLNYLSHSVTASRLSSTPAPQNLSVPRAAVILLPDEVGTSTDSGFFTPQLTVK